MMLDHNYIYKQNIVEKVELICVSGFGNSRELVQAINKCNNIY